MKTILVILAVILLLLSLAGCGLLNRSGFIYANADKYTVGGGELTADIENIDVDWIAGKVELTADKGSSVRFSETASRAVSNAETMRYWLDGATLHIKYYKSGLVDPINLSKTLTLSLPEGLTLSDLTVNTVSADALITDTAAQNIRIDTVSGRIDAAGITADVVKLDTVSGRVEVTLQGQTDTLSASSVSGAIALSANAVQDFDVGTTSGKVSLSFGNTPKTGKITTVSGAITLTVPADAEFTLKYNTVSGKFESSLPSTSDDKRYVFGTGSDGAYKVSTTSGSLRVSEK